MTYMKKTLAASIAVAAASSMAISTAHAEISDGEVRIGYLADMSGTYRDLAGPGGQTAMEMAVADFGGSVNGSPIVIFSADDRNSADVGANTVREWIDQRNVDMVGGLVASSVSIAVTKVLQENNGLGIVSGSAASSITNEHCTPNHIHWVYDTYPLANGTAMHADDFAQHHEIRPARQLDDLRHPAFQRRRAVGHPGAGDLVAGVARDAGLAEFIHLARPGARAHVHHVALGRGHDIDAEHPGFADIADAVLGIAAIFLGRGRAKHHLRRRIGDGVEKRIGRQIVLAVRAAAGNPADRARADNCAERVVRQPVAILGAIEHAEILWLYP